MSKLSSPSLRDRIESGILSHNRINGVGCYCTWYDKRFQIQVEETATIHLPKHLRELPIEIASAIPVLA